MALMTSSVEIEKIFETPLSYLRINVNFFKIYKNLFNLKDKIVSFCIQYIHREEFFSSLFDDEFINFLKSRIK